MGIMHDRMKDDLTLKNYSAKTREAYLRCARIFVEEMGAPTRVSEEKIRQYVVTLAEQASPATQKMHVAAIKFLYEVTLRRPERVASLHFPKVPRRLPDILSPDEVLRLLDAVACPKHRAVLTTIYAAGLRVEEACSLLTFDIDKARGVIHVRQGKRARDRYVMLSPHLYTGLRVYWSLCRPPEPILFPGDAPGTCVSAAAVRLALKEACLKTGITKRVTPHSLRHACATHLHESGVDLRTIQALLGHSSIRSTALYTHVSTAQIGKVKSPLDTALEEKTAP